MFYVHRCLTIMMIKWSIISLGGDAMTQWFAMKVIIQGFFYNTHSINKK